MVDNRIPTVSASSYFKAGDANSMANKMSEEKYGQGGEYFTQEMEEKEEKNQNDYQDRSAILRASLSGLAAANVNLVKFKKLAADEEIKEESNAYKVEKISKENNQSS